MKIRAHLTLRVTFVLLTMAGCEKATDPDEAPTWAILAAGRDHTCGLSTEGVAYCWGSNSAGQLGTDSIISTGASLNPTPTSVAGNLRFKYLDAAEYTTCALTSDGSAYCWGSGRSGQLGRGLDPQGRVLSSGIPVPVSGGFKFSSLSVGSQHVCGRSTQGVAVCWGGNTQGQLGRGTQSIAEASVPMPVSGGLAFEQISAGVIHTCGLARNGTAYCWGNNNYGQFGNASATGGATPTIAAGGTLFSSLSSGSTFTCGLRADNTALCWGDNRVGQLGIGSITASRTPAPVAGSGAWKSIRATNGNIVVPHTCALTAQGTAYCWGSNAAGKLGKSDVAATCNADPVALYGPCTTTPVQVAGQITFASLDLDATHTCGVATDGQGYCWGSNQSGQLGNGQSGEGLTSATPVRIPAPS